MFFVVVFFHLEKCDQSKYICGGKMRQWRTIILYNNTILIHLETNLMVEGVNSSHDEVLLGREVMAPAQPGLLLIRPTHPLRPIYRVMMIEIQLLMGWKTLTMLIFMNPLGLSFGVS